MSTITDTRSLALSMRIKIARVGAGMDQRQLADAVGVARTTVSGWERGISEPPLSGAVRLAIATGVTLDWLAEGVNDESPASSETSDSTVRPKGFEPLAFWSVVCAIPDSPADWFDEPASTVVELAV